MKISISRKIGFESKSIVEDIGKEPGLSCKLPFFFVSLSILLLSLAFFSKQNAIALDNANKPEELSSSARRYSQKKPKRYRAKSSLAQKIDALNYSNSAVASDAEIGDRIQPDGSTYTKTAPEGDSDTSKQPNSSDDSTMPGSTPVLRNKIHSPSAKPLNNQAKSQADPSPANTRDSDQTVSKDYSGPPELLLRGGIATIGLQRALDEALMNNPRTEGIRRRLGIARSELWRASELPNPMIYMDNGYKAEFTQRYGFEVPIEPIWKIVLRFALAKNQVSQANLEIASELWSFRADVRRAYTNLTVAQELYSTLSELAQLTSELAEVARKRFKAGDAAELDVLRAEQEATIALANKERQYFLLTEARQALAVLLGRNPFAEVTVPRLPPFGPEPEALGLLPKQGSLPPPLQVYLEKADINRPELNVVRQAIKTNKANLKLAYGNIIPNPVLAAGSSVVNGPGLDLPGLTSQAVREGFTPDSVIPEPLPQNIFRGYFVMVGVQLPILNFQQGDISLYRATAKQLEWQLRGQQNQVSYEVATAYQRMSGAQRKIERYRSDLLDKTTEIVRLARLSYEVGHSDINSTILTQQAAIEVLTDYLDTVSQFQESFTDLERSVGTPLH